MGLFSPQISLKKVVPLCRQLATSYDAGIPILRTIELVCRQEKDKDVREVLGRMHNAISKGSTLGEAAAAERRYLPTFFVELLSVGEKGGKLDVMLRDLAQYFEDRLQMRREIIGSLIYPALQLLAAWFLGTFALGIIRGISGVFSSNGRSQFNLSDYIGDYLRFQSGALLGFAVVFAISIVLSRIGVFGYVWGLFATHIWPISRVTRMFGLARFFRSMSLLIAGGLRIDHCIINSAAVTGNPYLERDLLQAVPYVRDGHTLDEAFAHCRMLLPQSREMLHIGEQSGRLEAMLKKASEYHLGEALHAVNVARRVLGVLITLVVGGLVGYVIISFYMTYFGMLDNLMNQT